MGLVDNPKHVIFLSNFLSELQGERKEENTKGMVIRSKHKGHKEITTATMLSLDAKVNDNCASGAHGSDTINAITLTFPTPD
jgi:hypothetical protein